MQQWRSQNRVVALAQVGQRIRCCAMCGKSKTQKGGGVYAGCEDFSRAITPSLPVPIKHDLIVGGPSARRRDGLTSFSIEGLGSRALLRSSLRIHASLMRAVRVRSRHFNGRQPTGLALCK